MREVYFLRVTDPYRYSEPLSGWEDVVARVYSLTSDIEEAEKCLALYRFTASVFHLMRVMEIGVQEFGTSLGVLGEFNKRWGDISNEIKQRIDKLADTTDTEKDRKRQMHKLKAHFDHVRFAWRNTTMHPKQTYTEEEAYDVMNKVHSFMNLLVRVI